MDMWKGLACEKRYRKASKKRVQRIEDYMELAGCARHQAAWVVRC